MQGIIGQTQFLTSMAPPFAPLITGRPAYPRHPSMILAETGEAGLEATPVVR
jgi:hypothetical protein